MSEEMSEVYEFKYEITVTWNRETGEFDYYYVRIAPEHDEEESKLIAVTMARIESAIYWGGLGKLCEETEVEEDE